jgi:adenosylcobyric acid synthase
MLQDLTKIPVAGVLPMLDMDIDDEDSLSERLMRQNRDALIDIAVIRLPRISNFTDFSALEATPGVAVRYVHAAQELGTPDMVILPGTKSTISDLLWLRQSGLEAAVKRLAADGAVVFGLCGGYQMLGRGISDAVGAEGGGEVGGMGLLPVETEFDNTKRRTLVTGRALEIGGVLSGLTGAELEGYEIHMGRTVLDEGAMPLGVLENGHSDGCWSGNVYGSYLHGFFDTAACREAVLGALCRKKGVSLRPETFDYKSYKEKQYDKLADGVRRYLDMDLIYRILEAGI